MLEKVSVNHLPMEGYQAFLAMIKTISSTLPSTGFQGSCAYLSKYILEDASQINELLNS